MNDFVSDDAFAGMLRAWFGNVTRVLEPGRCFYIWGGYSNIANYPPALVEAGLYFSQMIIWDKQHPVMTRKDYMGAHEWCFYGWKEGAGHKFFGPANETDLFVILLEPAGTSQLVRACVAGVTPVRVNVTAEADTFADVNDGVPSGLQSGVSGSAQILWKEAGTGTKWAVVRIGAPSVASGGTATVCRVVDHVSGAVYSVIEQAMCGEATFADAVGATAYHATNVGEIGNGSGGAVDDNALVLVAASGAYHVFSYPPYAKYRN